MVRGMLSAGFAVLAAFAGCDFDPPPLTGDARWFDDDGAPYCWIFECPFDLGADECGTCTHPLVDEECPPGFICTCAQTCIRGPRSTDAQPGCALDASPVDAMRYDWPACDMGPIP